MLRPGEFKRVFANSRRSADKFFSVLALENDLADARLGMAIAKKQVRRAVDRNRIKRLVRETFREKRNNLPNIDFIVLARHAVVEAGNPQLRASLQRHFKRLGQPKQGED